MELAKGLKRHIANCPTENPITSLMAERKPHWMIKSIKRLDDTPFPKEYPKFKGPGSKLANNIHPDCRTKSGIDSCLRIQKKKIRSLAIKWRLNKFGIYHKCRICNQPFNRNHQQCTDLKLSPVSIEKFNQSGERNVIDYLLNHKWYHEFEKAISAISKNIIPGNRDQPTTS